MTSIASRSRGRERSALSRLAAGRIWCHHLIAVQSVSLRTEHRMRRREFFAIVGGSFLWPLAARAQQAGKTYRVGLLATGGAMDERRRNILEGLAADGFFQGAHLQSAVRSG